MNPIDEYLLVLQIIDRLNYAIQDSEELSGKNAIKHKEKIIKFIKKAKEHAEKILEGNEHS